MTKAAPALFGGTDRMGALSYETDIIGIIIIVFYYFRSRWYSTDRKKKTDPKEVKTMKKLEMFLEEYFEICAHK